MLQHLQLRHRLTLGSGRFDYRLVGFDQNSVVRCDLDCLIGGPQVFVWLLQYRTKQFSWIQSMVWVKQSLDLPHRLPQFAKLAG